MIILFICTGKNPSLCVPFDANKPLFHQIDYSMKTQPFALIILFLLAISSPSIAQTKDKSMQLTKFMNERGISVISNWAHPLSTCHASKVVLSISGKNVYVTIPYTRSSKDYSCKYYLMLNSLDYISSFTVLNEGYSTYPCFSSCETINTLMAKVDVYKGDQKVVNIVEEIVHKTADNFTCKDYCLLGLNYYWIKNYRTAYRGTKWFWIGINFMLSKWSYGVDYSIANQH